jgi:hypothetical protein
MAEKNIALVILAIVVVIAVVGLVLVYTSPASAMSATQRAYVPGVEQTPEPAREYASGFSFKYYESSGEPVVEPAQFAGPIGYKTVQ